MDAAAGLAILLREKAEEFRIATFSDACVMLLPRRGFALRDAIVNSRAQLRNLAEARAEQPSVRERVERRPRRKNPVVRLLVGDHEARLRD
jgi:hypothetical protein